MINYYVVEIKGKRVGKFLSKIFKLNIDILDIKYYRNRIVFKVSYDDYKKIKAINTVYDIKVLNVKGIKKLNYLIKKYQIFLLFLILSISLIIILSNFIFFINIESDNTKMKSLIRNELDNNGITLFTHRRSYSALEKIAKDIKNKYKDKIEWIYISNDGVVLDVKFIERINNDDKKKGDLSDIVALKNGYIRDIYASSGEVVKFRGDYVRRGDVIISGNIIRNEKVVAKVRASGAVYAEVWYNVKMKAPLKVIKEEKIKKGSVYLNVEIFNRKFTLFKINKKIKKEVNKVIFKSPLGTLRIKKEFKVIKSAKKLNQDALVNSLEKEAFLKIKSGLKDKEHILMQKTLKKEVKNGRISIEVFFKAYENIAKEQDIRKIVEDKKEE